MNSSSRRLRERLLLVVSPWLLTAACSPSSSSGGSPTSTTTGDTGQGGAGGEAGTGASGAAGSLAGQGGAPVSGASGQGGGAGSAGATAGSGGAGPAGAAGGQVEDCEKGPTYPRCYALDVIAMCSPPPQAPATAWGLQPDGTMLCPPAALGAQGSFHDCTTVCLYPVEALPPENNECCYQMHQSSCCGRPLYVLGRALIAGLQRAEGWG